MTNKCPCHSDKLYSECCKPYHTGALAENALKLMRSSADSHKFLPLRPHESPAVGRLREGIVLS